MDNRVLSQRDNRTKLSLSLRETQGIAANLRGGHLQDLQATLVSRGIGKAFLPGWSRFSGAHLLAWRI
jgi:hypothetical protein